MWLAPARRATHACTAVTGENEAPSAVIAPRCSGLATTTTANASQISVHGDCVHLAVLYGKSVLAAVRWLTPLLDPVLTRSPRPRNRPMCQERPNRRSCQSRFCCLGHLLLKPGLRRAFRGVCGHSQCSTSVSCLLVTVTVDMGRPVFIVQLNSKPARHPPAPPQMAVLDCCLGSVGPSPKSMQVVALQW